MNQSEHKVERDGQGRAILFWKEMRFGHGREWVKWRVEYEGDTTNPTKVIRTNPTVYKGDKGMEVWEFGGDGIPNSYVFDIKTPRGFTRYISKVYDLQTSGIFAGKYRVLETIGDGGSTQPYLTREQVINDTYGEYLPGKNELMKLNSGNDEVALGDRADIKGPTGEASEPPNLESPRLPMH